MMPTPDQEARLKACKSSADYDAEWQRITNENLQTMTERTAAEIRALREQQSDFHFGYDSITHPKDAHDVKMLLPFNPDVISSDEIRLMSQSEEMHRKTQAMKVSDENDTMTAVAVLGWVAMIGYLVYIVGGRLFR